MLDFEIGETVVRTTMFGRASGKPGDQYKVIGLPETDLGVSIHVIGPGAETGSWMHAECFRKLTSHEVSVFPSGPGVSTDATKNERPTYPTAKEEPIEHYLLDLPEKVGLPEAPIDNPPDLSETTNMGFPGFPDFVHRDVPVKPGRDQKELAGIAVEVALCAYQLRFGIIDSDTACEDLLNIVGRVHRFLDSQSSPEA